MGKRRKPESVVKDAEVRRAANRLRKAGDEAAAKRLERNLPQKEMRG